MTFIELETDANSVGNLLKKGPNLVFMTSTMCLLSILDEGNVQEGRFV